MAFFAHSENEAGEKHDLACHLKSVAERASKFADKFDATELGYWAGLWHDLGKFHPDFQAYITSLDALAEEVTDPGPYVR